MQPYSEDCFLTYEEGVESGILGRNAVGFDKVQIHGTLSMWEVFSMMTGKKNTEMKQELIFSNDLPSIGYSILELIFHYGATKSNSGEVTLCFIALS